MKSVSILKQKQTNKKNQKTGTKYATPAHAGQFPAAT